MQQYNNPLGGTPSTVGSQINTDFYKKAALREIVKEQYFGQMADVTSMPKHFGKKIKLFHYLPMLDDANINDQGIDASGATTTRQVTIELRPAGATIATSGRTSYWAVGEGNSDANALTAAKAKAVAILTLLGLFDTDYATTKSNILALSPAWVVVENAGVPIGGNLYGSSKDVGYIQGKLPLLTENGGRVNRVGFSRREIEGTIEKMGFFDEYTKESMDFDTDEELEMHIHREMLGGANEITEDVLQIDLLNSAGILRYAGDATSASTIIGEGTISEVSYDDLVKLSISLDDNRCPKQTTIITGSRMTDTKVIPASRYMYIGSELLPTMERMKDYHNERAWIPIEKYGQAGSIARGEEGSTGKFRFIVVPEMMKWAGEGASVSSNEGYKATDAKYDVFPMLAIGEKSFTTIGFQTDGKTTKFSIKHAKPESDISYGAHDPFGEKGFMSIKWYYGFMPLRPERIALIKTVGRV